jgi:hypothetical protein
MFRQAFSRGNGVFCSEVFFHGTNHRGQQWCDRARNAKRRDSTIKKWANNLQQMQSAIRERGSEVDPKCSGVRIILHVYARSIRAAPLQQMVHRTLVAIACRSEFDRRAQEGAYHG